MSEMMLEQLSKRLDEISKRVDGLESPPKHPWWKPRSFSDVLFVIGVPAALMAAGWGFYDGVYLKLRQLDEATTQVAQEKLAELQELRSEIFVLGARGEDAEIAAIVEAKASRRDRLVQESYRYWQAQPLYFTEREKLLLAEELQLNSRPSDALEIVATLEPQGSIAQADMARFRGSLLGADGPQQDLEAAREAFQASMRYGAELDTIAGKEQLWAKTTFSWLFMELSQNSECDKIVPVAEALNEVIADDPDAYNLGVLDGQARMMLVTYQDRCPQG